MPKIAFNTANLVARVSGYRFSLSNWGEQQQKTVAATDAREFNAICAEISSCGYSEIELWAAHADPSVFTPAKAKAWREILDSHGLQAIAYAGPLSVQTAEICEWLEIGIVAGGGHPTLPDGAPDLELMRAICQKYGVRYGFENHPQKSSAECLAHVGGGDEWLGIAVDTGWFGTQGVSAALVIRELAGAVKHVHLKDVRAAGGHETCELGTGVVGIEEVFVALREIEYTGDFSWEDEPENRNPMEIAGRMREYIATRI